VHEHRQEQTPSGTVVDPHHQNPEGRHSHYNGEQVQGHEEGQRERKAREGRNPQTGQKMKIAAQKVPAFSAGNALKEAIYSVVQ
jgi:hypothetical protein